MVDSLFVDGRFLIRRLVDSRFLIRRLVDGRFLIGRRWIPHSSIGRRWIPHSSMVDSFVCTSIFRVVSQEGQNRTLKMEELLEAVEAALESIGGKVYWW